MTDNRTNEQTVIIAYRKDGKTYLLAMPSDHAEWAEEMLNTDLAATIREAKAKAVEEAVCEVEDLIDGYEGTADDLRNQCKWADSNRYSNYAAGMNIATGKLRLRAAEYRKAVGS